MTDNYQCNILNDYGGLNNNSLLNILDAANVDEEEPIIFEQSNYMDNEALIYTLKEKNYV